MADAKLPATLPDLGRIGPYRVERALGRGGMGEVYAGYDERLDRPVALKRARTDARDPERARRRFRREARAVARLHHPAIVAVHDWVETDDGDWIVMQYVEGRSLRSLLEGGPLEPGRAALLARDLLEGLAAAHQAGVVHRDLKAENVMVSPVSSAGRSGRRLAVPGRERGGDPEPHLHGDAAAGAVPRAGRAGGAFGVHRPPPGEGPAAASGERRAGARRARRRARGRGAGRDEGAWDDLASGASTQLSIDGGAGARWEEWRTAAGLPVPGPAAAARRRRTLTAAGVLGLTLAVTVLWFRETREPLCVAVPETTVAVRPVHGAALDLDLTAAAIHNALLRGLLGFRDGTGKEIVARALHDAGRRGGGPFVTVNMAALPPTLAASELFGAVRGAYTGADRGKKGFFESAEGGTLFLDEIGEVPPDVQALLLRTLENREVQPVGSVETRKVDVRVIAATDSDLETAIASGSFRAPLLHRLEGYEIRLPPLRERRDDVARLLYLFLGEELAGGPRPPAANGLPWPPAEVVARLAAYDWPGNVRQLRNVARRLALASRRGRERDLGALVDDLLKPSSLAADTPSGSSVPVSRGLRKPVDVGEEELVEALERHRWQLKPAARALGVSRATLYRLIESSPRIRKASELESGEIEAALARHRGDPEAAACELRVSPQGLKRRMTLLGLG